MSTPGKQPSGEPLGIGRALLALGLYTAASVLLFGWALWPHPGRGIVGLAVQAPESYLWEFAWWAHALSSVTNPFVSHAVYAPVGVNLTWTPTAPGLGFLFTPLTFLVGPAAAYNLAALLMPALSAWTAFLLCRYLTRSSWAALVGGFLFGFSGYMTGHEYGGDLNLTALALVPLVALVVLRYLRAEIDARGLAWRLGIILALQLVVSTEIALTLTLALAAALVAAWAVSPRDRRRLVSALPPIVVGYGIAGVLTAPFIYYLLTGLESGQFVGVPTGDLLNIVVPTHLIAAGGSVFASVSAHFDSNDQERDLYVGIPTLLIVGLYFWPRRRQPGARFLLASFLVPLVLALGASLRVEGRTIVAMPWALSKSVPLLDNLIPTRFAVYSLLAASVAVAIWIASAQGRLAARPVVLPALALASIVPATWHGPFVRIPPRPAFFAQKLYKSCIPRGETLTVFPYGRFGDSMLWQAESGFWFNLAEGDLGRDTYPPKFVFADETVQALQFFYEGPDPRPTMDQLKAYAKLRDVGRIISVASGGYPSGSDMQAFGLVQTIGDVYVSPACGDDALTDGPG